MPSSICCPFGEKIHFCADGIFLSLNVSELSSLLNNPVLLTHEPRFVETETSGDVVMILLLNSELFFAY